jgi:membrane protein
VRLNARILFWLVRRSVFAAFDDGCLGIAKGAAYSALLSFFPVLTSAATILVQTRAEFVSRILENSLSEIVPPGTEDLVVQQFRVTGARPAALLIVAGLVSVWAASGVIKSLMEGFQAAYRIPRSRGFLHTQAIAIALVLLSAFPLVCATLLIVFGAQVEGAILHLMKVDPVLTPLSSLTRLVSRGARYLLAFITTVSVASTLYYFGPYRRQRWRYVWPGAVLATLCWLLATAGFAWYVRNIGNYNVMYGSVGAGIALLVWMYLMAVIALIGCEFNAEFEQAAASTAAHPLQMQHGETGRP